MVSLSHDASWMVCASAKRFAILRAADGTDGEKRYLLHASGGSEDETDSITAILCVPVLKPSNVKTRPGSIIISVVVGYSSGNFRVFNDAGVLLVSQLFNPAPVISLKLRPVPSIEAGDAEELLIVYADKKAVSIDGASLWVAIRVGNGQLEQSELLRMEQPSLTYKKWQFNTQEQISDLVSCGPAKATPLAPPTFSAATGQIHRTSFNARYIGVGRPMITFYATSDASRSYSLAGLVASRVTSVVSSAVFSLKSFWGTAPPPPPVSEPPSNATLAPATPIPAILTLADTHRHVTSIALSPPSPATGKSPLAVLADSLGRVMVLDVEEGELIRMWKGIRDAQCGWVQVPEESDDEDIFDAPQVVSLERVGRAGSITMDHPLAEPAPAAAPGYKRRRRRTHLLLAIFAGRGVLEVYHMRHGPRVAAFNVGTGMRLVQTANGVLGGAFAGAAGESLATCYLVSPQGDMRKIHVPYAVVAGISPRSELRAIKRLIKAYRERTDDTTHQKIVLRLKERIGSMRDLWLKAEAISYIPDTIPPSVHLSIIDAALSSTGGQTSPRSPKGVPKTVQIQPILDLSLRERLLRYYVSSEQTHGGGGSGADTVVKGMVDEMMTEDTRRRLAAVEDTSASSVPAKAGPATFAGAFCVSDSGGEGVVINLRDALSGDVRLGVAGVLVEGLVGHAGDAVRGLGISVRDWATLLIEYLDNIPSNEVFGYSSGDRLLSLTKAFLLVMEEAMKQADRAAFDAILEYGWTTKKTGKGLVVARAARSALDRSSGAIVEELRPPVASLNTALDNCIGLLRFGPDAVGDLNVAARDFGKFENTCSRRLAALRQVWSNDAGDKVTFAGGGDGDDLSRIYLSFEYGQKWSKSNEIDAMHQCIANIVAIPNPALRNAMALAAFSRFFADQLRSVADLVEKARRVPPDQQCVRRFGMNVETTRAFLVDTLSLFNSIDVDGDIRSGAHSASNMRAAVQSAMAGDMPAQEPPSSTGERYFNHALSVLLETVGGARPGEEDQVIGRKLLHDHRTMVTVLTAIFTLDLKLVRPMKCFSSAFQSSFCGSLLVQTSGVETQMGSPEDGRVMTERAACIAKVAEADPAQAETLKEMLNGAWKQ
ncbi:Rab3 GTPase-activating protein non-catalytic subunit [Borealophlyctis nickersoniae]|nr:Rab3 GTPase-activating protein non-catalytic subunit [Borealophlyctis nickersoniae]